jgi:hypothetical protein
MRIARRPTRWAAGAGFLVVVVGPGIEPVTGPVGQAAELAPSASTTTTVPGAAERWFKFQWSVEPGRGSRRIAGYVCNTYGQPVSQVRLLGQALDQSGALVGQRLVWVPGGISGFSRAYFEIDRLPDADHYRVTVWSFDVTEIHF